MAGECTMERWFPGFPAIRIAALRRVTVARRGFIDHSDSLGAKARYGHGDLQWMTAGSGIVHSEMFPLTQRDDDNPCELFQIWMNLPAAAKMVPAHFKMLWAETIPKHTFTSPEGQRVDVEVLAGTLGELVAPTPTPNSWAADPANEVGIYTLGFSPGARFTLEPASAGVNRTVYFFFGSKMTIAGRDVSPKVGVQVQADAPLELVNQGHAAEVLVLQGKPIGEPVAHYGPFVMNTRAELEQAFTDYRRTQFGGWPWDRDDPVHGAEDRFALHPDGRLDKPQV